MRILQSEAANTQVSTTQTQPTIPLADDAPRRGDHNRI
jgi:hypothetical protein